MQMQLQRKDLAMAMEIAKARGSSGRHIKGKVKVVEIGPVSKGTRFRAAQGQ
jgi:hypothetical protein